MSACKMRYTESVHLIISRAVIVNALIAMRLIKKITRSFFLIAVNRGPVCPLLDWSVGPPGGGKAPSSWLPTAETKKNNESNTSSIQTVVVEKTLTTLLWHFMCCVFEIDMSSGSTMHIFI